MAAPIPEFVVSLSSDKQILSQRSISDALTKSSKLKAEVAQEKKKEEKAEQEIDAEWEVEMLKEDGKLIVESESSEEHVSWGSAQTTLALGALRASASLHKWLIKTILGTTLWCIISSYEVYT
ncbi:hypothetical protein C0989_002099, partial [Termitomyces sp. Mn162]